MPESLGPEQESSNPFEGLAARVEPDPFRVEGAHALKFESDGAVTTVRVVFGDYSGADVLITNMTTLPEEKTNQGLGSAAIQNLLAWAANKGFGDIRATQVRQGNEGFWLKNGFVRMEEPNPTGDYQYKPR
jgi:hypothetical protein